MRRLGAFLAVLSGIALIVAAFLDVVTKSGGNIVADGGNLPATLGGLDSWVGWLLLGAGALVLLAGLALLRYRSRIVGGLLFLGGAAAAAVGIWALADPLGFYAQVGALQVGGHRDTISNILEQFDTGVTAEIGAWIAAIAGAVAALLGIMFVFAPKRAVGMDTVTQVAGSSGAPEQRETMAAPVAIETEEISSADEPPATPGEARGSAESVTMEGPELPDSEPAESGDVPLEPPPADEARRSAPDADDWR